jgi:two-component system, NarL family, response regulator NreC
MSKLRIFLVDDHGVLRMGLQMLIDAQPDMHVVGQADNGQAAVQNVVACQPDVVIMDIAMPKLNGVEATAAIKAILPTVRVLTLTRHSDPGYLRRLLHAGATGYVLKKAAADDLINAIRSVAAGSVYIDPALAEAVTQQLGNHPQAKPTTANGHPTLSERETEVLRRIAWGQSNKEIAAGLGLSIKTVEYYKASAAEKLHLYSRAAIVRYALAQGWLQADEEPEE